MMPNSSTNNQGSLEEAWDNVWDFWGPDNSWKNDQSKCIDILKRLSHFDSRHSNDPDHIDEVIKAVTRGVALVEAAAGWQNPAIGKNTPRKELDKLRGTQWRLVVAYSGFEITFKALMHHKERTTNNQKTPTIEIIKRFLHKCNLPEYSPLTSPEKKSNLEKWLNKEEGKLAEFLGLSYGDRQIIENWIVKSEPIDSWEKAVKLAKAIRNASAHGFLVATKVKEWGLKPGLCRLTDDLALIVSCGLNKLT